MDSTITPQKLFESGKYRDIETASEVFILMKRNESLQEIIEDAKRVLGKTLLREPVLDRAIRSGTVQIHDFRRNDRGDNL